MNEFKLIVAGGRDFTDYNQCAKAITVLATAKEMYGDYSVSIVSGMARGADTLGAHFAKLNRVKVYKFFADWDEYGKRAGFIRNEAMGTFADGLLAFWDQQSRGTEHMIRYMQSLGKPVHIVNYGVSIPELVLG
jgi:YspA, cpYpsA-related SLOG family